MKTIKDKNDKLQRIFSLTLQLGVNGPLYVNNLCLHCDVLTVRALNRYMFKCIKVHSHRTKAEAKANIFFDVGPLFFARSLILFVFARC